MFKTLTPDEEKQFRQWARDNYQPHTEIAGIWHPVIQDECVKINAQNDEVALQRALGKLFKWD